MVGVLYPLLTGKLEIGGDIMNCFRSCPLNEDTPLIRSSQLQARSNSKVLRWIEVLLLSRCECSVHGPAVLIRRSALTIHESGTPPPLMSHCVLKKCQKTWGCFNGICLIIWRKKGDRGIVGPSQAVAYPSGNRLMLFDSTCTCTCAI